MKMAEGHKYLCESLRLNRLIVSPGGSMTGVGSAISPFDASVSADVGSVLSFLIPAD